MRGNEITLHDEVKLLELIPKQFVRPNLDLNLNQQLAEQSQHFVYFCLLHFKTPCTCGIIVTIR